MDAIDKEIEGLERELAQLESKSPRKSDLIDDEIKDLERQLSKYSKGDATEELKQLSKSKKKSDDGRYLENEGYIAREARGYARGAKDIAAGAMGLGDLLTMPLREGANFALRSSGYPEYQMRPAQEIVSEGVDELTGGYTKPKSRHERFKSAITQEVASIPIGGALIKAPHLINKTTKFGKAQNFVAGMYSPSKANLLGTAGGTGAVHHYLEGNENPSTVSALLSGAAGGVGANYLSRAGIGAIKGAPKFIKAPLETTKDAGRRTVGKLAGFDPELYKQHVEAGIPASLASVSKNPIISPTESILYHTPGAGGHMKEFYQDRTRAFLDKMGFEKIQIDDIPKGIQHELAHEGAQGFKAKKSREYGKLKEHFEPFEKHATETRQMVDVSDLHNKLNESRLGVSGAFETKEAASSIRGKALSTLEGYLQDSGSRNIEIPYGSLERFRGKMLDIRDSLPTGSNERREASKIYKDLSSKRHDFIEMNGSKLESAASKKARKDWTDYSRTDVSNMSKKDLGEKQFAQELLDKKDDASAFARLLSKNPKYLETVRKGLPQDRLEDLRQSLLGEMGSKGRGEFNLSAMVTNFNKFKDTNGAEFRKLYKNPDAASGVEKVINLLSHNKKVMESMANTSKTAHTASYIDYLKKSGAIGGHLATGAYIAGAKAFIPMAITLGGAKVAAKLMTDQTFLARINKVMTANSPKAQANHFNSLMRTPSVKELMSSNAYRSFKNQAKKDDGE